MKLVGHLRKALAAPASGEAGEENRLTSARVSEVFRLHGTASAIVPEDSALSGIIVRLADDPSLRGVFLVDKQGRLSGTLSRVGLLRWAHLQLFRGRGRHRASVSEFFGIINADKVKDVARGDPGSLSVRENETLQAALDRMIDHEEDVLPVLNSQGQIVGDLRLSEVLQFMLMKGRWSQEKSQGGV